MEFRVPPDCKDSPFHYKWRLHVLKAVQEESFWRLHEEVRIAVKKFLDHPTSLPYEHQKVLNFMTNSMIIVNKEVLNWALDWFREVRISFFETVQSSNFVPAAEVPYEPPPNPNAAERSSSHSSSDSFVSDQAAEREPDSTMNANFWPKTDHTKFELLMEFPIAWPWNHVVGHLQIMRKDFSKESIQRVNRCVARLILDSAEDMIELLKQDSMAKFSMFGEPRPRIYVTREAMHSLPVVTVQSADVSVEYSRELIPSLIDVLGCRVINLFHDMDGFVAIFESTEAVESLMKLRMRNLVVAGKSYPVIITKGF